MPRRLVQVLPGAMGVAWPPRGDSAKAIDAATASACEWLSSRGVKVCQAFAAASEAADMAPLERRGFRHTTQLVFMRHEVDHRADQFRPGDWAGGTHYHPAIREEFAATLLATHTGTLDCPELNGSRTANELLAGFELPDSPATPPWHFLAEDEGRAVGVLVTNPNERRLEIIYLGVVPSCRGRGYGDRLVRRAQFDASIMACTSVTLSVDARNTPAMKLYERHGFVEYDRREVWLASWPR